MPRTRPNVKLGQEFTPSELTVIYRLALGETNREIADGLGISIDAVKYDIANMQVKTGTRNRVQLAVWWVTEGVAHRWAKE